MTRSSARATPKASRGVQLAAFALLGLTGAIGSAGAAETIVVPEAAVAAPVAVEAPADLPRFVPSVEPETDFGEAFAPFDDPDIVALPEPVASGLGSGVASWYGPGFAGRKTASGERFNPSDLTAAHRTLPFGSKVRVTHGGRSVVVRINDRGPFHGGRVIDLSQAAAEQIGLRARGSGKVELALIES